MSAAGHPLTLWLAALGCLAMAVRARGAAARDAGRPAPRVPAVLRAAARCPVPAAVVRHLSRGADPERIAQAGLAGWVAPGDLARARGAAAVAGASLALPLALVAPPAALLVPALALAGLLAPGRWVERRAAARRAAIARELPDLLDLLGICVEAGMALDPALALAADRLGGAAGDEVRRVLADLALGAPRAAAYRALAERVGAPELAQTVAALLQAEELGAPLSRALEGQAEGLRVARRQAARERAATAAPKIQLVVALLMVPAALILVLGALVAELSRQLGAVVGGP